MYMCRWVDLHVYTYTYVHMWVTSIYFACINVCIYVAVFGTKRWEQSSRSPGQQTCLLYWRHAVYVLEARLALALCVDAFFGCILVGKGEGVCFARRRGESRTGTPGTFCSAECTYACMCNLSPRKNDPNAAGNSREMWRDIIDEASDLDVDRRLCKSRGCVERRKFFLFFTALGPLSIRCSDESCDLCMDSD